MSAVRAQSYAEDRASGAQVIDGSVYFNEEKGSYLTRTPSSAGNRLTWTWSCWCKIAKLPVSGTNGDRSLFSAVDAVTDGDDDSIRLLRTGTTGANSLSFSSSEYNVGTEEWIYTNALLRDPEAFYHIVVAKDTTQSSLANGQLRMYINGVQQSVVESNAIAQNAIRAINSTVPHAIGDHYSQNRQWDGLMSQVYFIDGKSLDASYFGFTDPLTGTWRPKKFEPPVSLNKGITWSSQVSGSFNGSYTADNAFDGNVGGTWAIPADGQDVTWTPSSAITATDQIRLYLNKNGTGGTLTQDGTDLTSGLSAGNQWVTLPSKTLTTLVWGSNGAYNQIQLMTVQVDGEILVDGQNDVHNYGTNGVYLPMDGSALIGNDQSGNGNDWTLKNFGDSNFISKATGVLPVYNTQGSGNIIASPTVRGQAGIAVTVYNPTGSQNRYYFDGVEAPSYNFARGQNVTFDLGDSTVATHQLKFSTTSDGTHGGGSAYDTGAAYGAISAGTVGAATTITFPHNAENTLYYYCVNHSGMGGSVGLTTDIQRADTYASDCVLAAPLYDVEDGSSWEDLSNKMNPNSAEKTVNDNGARARGTYQDYWNFYRRACYFDASDDYVSIASGYADLGLGSGAFTIEGWAYTGTDGTANQVIITSKRYYQGGYDGNWIIRRSNNSQLLFGSFDGTGNEESNNFTCDFSKDCWHHFAFVRNSTGTNGCTMYVDGIDCGNMTVSKSLDDGNASGIFMGTEHNSSTAGDNKWDGFMQDIRIYKGVAKYTSEFIPAATKPSILPSTPAGVSYGSQLTALTEGSVSFEGSGDYLSIADSSDYDLGTNDFTIEFFVYKAVTGKMAIFETRSWGGDGFNLEFSSADKFEWYDPSLASGNDLPMDPTPVALNSWTHFAITRNGSFCRMYRNGKEVGTAKDVGSNSQSSDGTPRIGISAAGANELKGFISNFRFINGTAIYTHNFIPPIKPLTTTSQGATASEVKLLCCQSKNSATVSTGSAITIERAAGGTRPLASDFNPFETNNDQVISESSEYATLNPLSKNSNVSLTDGNLAMSISSAGHYSSIATLGMTTGKYYWEVGAGKGWSNDPAWGIVGEEAEHYDDQTNSVPGAWVRNNGRRYYEGTEGDVWMAASQMNVNSGNTLGLAYDGTAGTLQVFINGITQGTAFTGLKKGMTRNLGSGTSNTWYPVFKMYDGGPINVNFGQKPFKFAPPKGFLPLCASNLERPQFVRSNSVVGVSTWRGTSADNHFIPSGFQADLLWTKDRDTSANWYCFDSVRGRTQVFHPNLSNAESGPENNIIRSLTNTNGYVLGQGGDANNSSYNYVGYSWKAGGNAGTFNKDGVDAGSAAAAGVSDGSITPTACSVGTREGFSIIKYTSTGSNATVGHGLNATPQLIIVKNTDNNNNWHVYHEALGNTKFLYLDLDYAADTGAGAWNNTSPTSTVFSLGTGNGTNSSSNHEYMAYCWCNKPGLQKFGSYTGNADSGGDGPYVELGFRPALVWFKATTGTQPWNLFDSERGTINPIDEGLLINTTGSEFTGTARVDYLSNGFKVRAPSGGNPNVATTYIYCAWAETPFHNLYGATGTAR